ncbi:replicative DNA helicase [Gordonia alkanivorans]|uniref:replicative DNA helicase n=1 Tax=Gordonia alkanivorans TaxID=84096 RepID=UPI0004BBA198|nr:DnaB-like helicase C-terminal domain-containing protein [Gordonia alkanivorans]
MTSTTTAPVAERVVLGALIGGTSVDYLQDAMAILAPAAFSHPSMQKVFTAVSDLFVNGTPVGLESVREHMSHKGTLDAVGGYPGLTDLTITVLSEPQAAPRQYLAQLADAYAAAAAARQLQSVAAGLGNDLSLDEARARTEAIFAQPSHLSAVLPGLHDQVAAFDIDLRDRIADPNSLRGVPSGWELLDGTPDRRPLIGGFRNSWLIYVAARPSVGKTLVLLDFVRAACKSNIGVYFASTEMGEQEVIARLVVAECATVRQDDLLLRPDKLTNTQREQVQNALAQIAAWPLVIDDTAVNTSVIASRAAAARSKFRAEGTDLGLVAQDYVQLLQDPPGVTSTSSVARVAGNSTRLKMLGKRLHVPVIAAAQFNRASVDRPPRIDDLKDAGQLEQDADVIIGLHRPYATAGASATDAGYVPEDMTAYLLKNRHGSAGAEIKRTFLGWKGSTVEPSFWANRCAPQHEPPQSPP